MDQQELAHFLERYIGMWHEADPERRGAIIDSLWAGDAENLSSTFTVRGREEIIARVTRAYDQWVAEKKMIFRPLPNLAATHHNVVKFSWEMVPRAGGPAAARGVDFFVLREDGKILVLYHFGEPL